MNKILILGQQFNFYNIQFHYVSDDPLFSGISIIAFG